MDIKSKFIRGLIIRFAVYLIGVVPLLLGFKALGFSGEVLALTVLLYAAGGGCYFGAYCVKHADEIPPPAPRR
jgi:hypothetical protein